MTTIIIMTNVTSPYGKYIMFETEGRKKHIGEVDRRDGKYVIYYDGNGKSLGQIGSRSNKDSAIKFLQDTIKAGITGEVKFKWNVIQERYKFV